MVQNMKNMTIKFRIEVVSIWSTPIDLMANEIGGFGEMWKCVTKYFLKDKSSKSNSGGFSTHAFEVPINFSKMSAIFY